MNSTTHAGIWLMYDGDNACKVLDVSLWPRQNRTGIISCSIHLADIREWCMLFWMLHERVGDIPGKASYLILQTRQILFFIFTSNFWTNVSDWFRSPARIPRFQVQSGNFHLVPAKVQNYLWKKECNLNQTFRTGYLISRSGNKKTKEEVQDCVH